MIFSKLEILILLSKSAILPKLVPVKMLDEVKKRWVFDRKIFGFGIVIEMSSDWRFESIKIWRRRSLILFEEGHTAAPISGFDAEARATFPDNWAVSAVMRTRWATGARQHGAPCAARNRALGIRSSNGYDSRVATATYRLTVVLKTRI